jgi:hypothetical protein
MLSLTPISKPQLPPPDSSPQVHPPRLAAEEDAILSLLTPQALSSAKTAARIVAGAARYRQVDLAPAEATRAKFVLDRNAAPEVETRIERRHLYEASARRKTFELC